MAESFIDADSGLDSNGGTSTVDAYKTFDAFCNAARTAGDFATIRGGMTATYQLASPADLIFTSDGTVPAPIRMEYDYDDQFSDHVDLSVTATATLTVGSKVWTYSADVSGVVAAGDVLFAAGDDAREFAYEVESVSTVTVTMFLPYKGAQAGAGKTTTNMQGIPIWGTAAAVFQVNLDDDQYWMFQGLKFTGADTNGVFEVDGAASPLFRDCAFVANNAEEAFNFTDDFPTAIFVKCRFFDYLEGIAGNSGISGFFGEARDCLLDGNSVANSRGFKGNTGVNARFIECEFKNHGDGDIDYNITVPTGGANIQLRNVSLASTTEVNRIDVALAGRVLIEDHDGEPGDTRQLSYLSSGEAVPVIQSDTGTVRSGGNNISIKVTPSTDFANVQGWEHSRQQLFEHAFFAVADVAKTYTVYFRPTATADWTADPLATELFIEADYWGHATNDVRIIKQSTEVIDMNGSTAWQALTVAVTPAQSGVLYLRGVYSKTKEAQANTFFCDPLPEVA